MKLVIRNTLFNLSFKFAQSSYNKVVEADRLLNEGVPLMLFCDDGDFKMYVPELLASCDHGRNVIIYDNLTQLHADLGLSLMMYDKVKAVDKIGLIENNVKILPDGNKSGIL